jgi:Spy/CpxP family protein refolding chaperone
MKKISLIAALILILGSATIVMAGQYCKAGKMGPGCGMNPKAFAALNLTEEQSEKIRALRQAHEKDILPLRTQMFTKRAEMRLLWMETDPDREKIKAKQKEIHELKGQLQEKNMDFRFAVSDILTPEQRSKLLQKKFGKHAGPHESGGPGHGPGMMGMDPDFHR